MACGGGAELPVPAGPDGSGGGGPLVDVTVVEDVTEEDEDVGFVESLYIFSSRSSFVSGLMIGIAREPRCLFLLTFGAAGTACCAAAI